MANVLEQEWQDYFVQLNDAEKKSVLVMIKTFLASRNISADVIDIERYNKEIDEALTEVAEGNYILQEEMEKQAAKW